MQPNKPSDKDIEQLNALIDQATKVGDSATGFSAQRLKMCVQIGDRLREWKVAIPRGQWGCFLESHFPALPERTSQRWMRLAEANAGGRLQLESARGLRHAYQLAGLLPDAETAPKGGSKPESYVVHIARLVAALQHIQLDQLTSRDRNDLRQRLKPAVELYQKL